jgi:hypothetical protein
MAGTPASRSIKILCNDLEARRKKKHEHHLLDPRTERLHFTKDNDNAMLLRLKLHIELQLEKPWLGFQTHPHGAGDEAAAYHSSPP